MKEEFVKKLVHFLFKKYNLEGWNFAFDDRKRIIGHCIYSKRTIYLSRNFVRLNNLLHIKATLLHEIAHALVGSGYGHRGLLWKQTCKQLNISSRYYYSNNIILEYKWKGTCPRCKKEWKRHRRVANGFCPVCNKKIKWERIKHEEND